MIYWSDADGEFDAGQLLTGRIEVTKVLGEKKKLLNHFFLSGFCPEDNIFPRHQTEGELCIHETIYLFGFLRLLLLS